MDACISQRVVGKGLAGLMLVMLHLWV